MEKVIVFSPGWMTPGGMGREASRQPAKMGSAPLGEKNHSGREKEGVSMLGEGSL